MTPQEIQDFVRQPTPRKIPKNVWRKTTKLHNLWHYIAVFGLFMLVLAISYLMAGTILLDIGNKKTTQGAIIGWERRSLKAGKHHKEGKPYYRVSIRFSTPSGEVVANCYVYDQEIFPGWGQIPESRDEQVANAFVSLKEPFPVAVEYVPWYPSFARMAGTQAYTPFTSCGSFSPLSQYLLALTVIFIVSALLLGECRRVRRETKHLLAEGLFAISHGKPSLHSFRGTIPSWAIVSFSDLDGVKREGRCDLSPREGKMCIKLHEKRLPGYVGLLYLPYMKNIVITDLWQDI